MTTEGCRLIRDFALHLAKPCRRHNTVPRLHFEGLWIIECQKGCSLHQSDPFDPKPHTLIATYRANPF